jgi:hypothetical protein
LYIEEPGTEAVRRWAEEAEVLATCRVAYPELISALKINEKISAITKYIKRLKTDSANETQEGDYYEC